ncbi:MAG: hypothetical protein Q8O31_05365 [Rhodocyclaceae bacterium]|nr:hypothetical protein [Rhodocyclaceae bacterium]
MDDTPPSQEDLIAALPEIMSTTTGLRRIRLLEQILKIIPDSMAAYRVLRLAYQRGWQGEPHPDSLPYHIVTDDGFYFALLTAFDHCRQDRLDATVEIVRTLATIRPAHPITNELLANLLHDGPEYERADTLYTTVARRYAWPSGLNRCSDRYFQTLPDHALALGTPPQWLYQRKDTLSPAIAVISADPHYLERYLPKFLETFSQHRAESGLSLHLHIVNGDETHTRLIPPSAYDLICGITCETMDLPDEEINHAYICREHRTYYACARFRLLPMLLKHYVCPLWILDIDIEINRSLSMLCPPHYANADIAYIPLSAGWAGPFVSCFVTIFGLFPTPLGIQAAQLIRASIEERLNIGQSGWGLDQAVIANTLCYLRRHHPDFQVASLSAGLVGSKNTPTESPLLTSLVGSCHTDE